jgi:very-short-patch-repair endonuclease
MGRRALVPAALTAGPFTLKDAIQAGLDRGHLKGASWRRIGPAVYVWTGLADAPELRIEAARMRLPSVAVFSGLTAAWLHGLDVEACQPIEVTIPKGSGVSARSGLAVRRDAISAKEVVRVSGKRVTTMLRTLCDLSSRLSVTEAVTVVDMALHAGLVSLDDLRGLCARRTHSFGVARLRRVVGFAEPAAESPMESRLRMVLLLGGLPRPEAQTSIHDSKGRFLGRPDLYYPSHRLALEYDGGTHRTSLVEDNRRQNRLLAAGIRLLRFTAGDVLRNPDSIRMQVRGYLASRPVLSPVPARVGSTRVR